MWTNYNNDKSNDSFGNAEDITIASSGQPVHDRLVPFCPVIRIKNDLALQEEQYGKCSKPLCMCRQISDRKKINRSKGKNHASKIGSDWTLVQSFSVIDTPITAQINPSIETSSIVDIQYSNIYKILNEAKDTICKRSWIELKAKDTISSDGCYSQYFNCRYVYHCDCNCKLWIKYSITQEHVEIFWWNKGSSHLISGQQGHRFLTLEAHSNFQHIRIPRNKDSLPIEMVEVMEKLLLIYPKIMPKKMIQLIDNHSNKNEKVFRHLFEANRPIISKKITSYLKTEKKKLVAGSNMIDTLSNIQEWALNNTYDKVLERETKQQSFSIHSMFVCAHEIKIDESYPPNDRELRKSWKPNHTCQIILTSVSMSSFIPKLASRGDIHRALQVGADTTFKLFFSGQFHLHILFVHDGTTGSKICGFGVSCSMHGGNYYLLTRACRNVSEYFCSLHKNELPNGISSLPLCIPSPMPPCTRSKPLVWNKKLSRYEQPKGSVYTFKSIWHLSESSSRALKQVDQNTVVFSPELIPDINKNEPAKHFRMDLDELNSCTISDGDISIQNGISAAIPSISNLHNDCNAHMHRNFVKLVNGKFHKEDQPKLDLDLFAKEESIEKQKKARNTCLKALYTFCDDSLKATKYCTVRGLATIIFDDCIERLKSGLIPGCNYPQIRFANRLAKMFERCTTDGSSGTWRYSDLLDAEAIKEKNVAKLIDSKTQSGSLKFGIVDNTNSEEAFNKDIKVFVERKSGTVIETLNNLCNYGTTYTQREIEEYGVSFCPLPYGYGRYSSTRHAEDNRKGMCFLGYANNSLWMDQRTFVLRVGKAENLRVYMLQGEKQLQYLDNQMNKIEGYEPIPRRGCASKKEQIKLWFQKYKHIVQSNGKQLKTMIDLGTLELLNEQLNDTKATRLITPENVHKVDKKKYARTKTQVIEELMDFESAFVVLTPKIGNYENILEQPFWKILPKDQQIVYKWNCSCKSGLKYGHCAHIFFITHGLNDKPSGLKEGYMGVGIPTVAVTENLSEKRNKGRPSQMGPALQKLRKTT